MPDRTRTCDLRIRNPLLYPTELRAHEFMISNPCIKKNGLPFVATSAKRAERRMVGATGFEPATPRSQSECATNCATPRNQIFDVQFQITQAGVGWGERRGSNPRLSEPQSDALPTELRPP